MGNISCTVSGFGAGDASRKSIRGSARSCQRKRAASSCRLHADNNWLLSVIAEKRRAKVTTRLQERGQVTSTARVLQTSLEELLDDCSSGAQNVDVDAASDCVSPFSDAGSGYFSDAMISLRDEPDDDEDDDTDEGRLIYRISRVGR